METPRPLVDVVHLDLPSKMKRDRAKRMKNRLPQFSSEEKAVLRKIITKWRRRQRKLAPEYGTEDPHPYEYTYVFYCLEAGAAVDK